MTPTVPTTEPGRFEAFTFAPYARYWTARLCSTLAIQIVAVAVAWQIYDLTRNPADLGIIGLVQFLPLLQIALVTGSVADRFGRSSARRRSRWS